MVVQYISAQDAATAVGGAVRQADAKHCTVRPYNRFQPEESDWWIIPSRDFPAFHHGKYFFSSHRADSPGGVYIGLKVEKGFGGVARGVVSPALVMNDDWIWSRFIDDLGSGKIMEAGRVLERTANVPVLLRIEAALAQDRSADSDRPFGDLLCFEVSDGLLRATQHQSVRGMLDGVASAASASEIASRLRSLPDLDWTWVSLWIGGMFRLGGPGNGMGAREVADCVLRPWSQWFR